MRSQERQAPVREERMRTYRNRRIQQVVFAAGLAVSGILAGSNTLGADPGDLAAPGETLTKATQLLEQGRPLQCKRLLSSIDRNELDTQQRVELMTLLRQVDRDISNADRNDLSLEKAEIALSQGDLRLAEKHAQAVDKSQFAGDSQKARARSIMANIESARNKLKGKIDSLLRDGTKLLQQGRTEQARAIFSSIYDSGVSLTPEQENIFLKNYAALLDGEVEQGAESAASRVLAAMYQPGRVVRRNENTQKKEKTEPEQPVNENPPAAQPEQETPPPAQEQEPPAAQPEPQQQEPEQAQPEPQPQPEEQPPAAQPENNGQPQDMSDLAQKFLRVEALDTISRGDQAYEENRWKDAIDAYRRALDSFGDYLTQQEEEHARKYLSLARAKLDEGELIGTVLGEVDIARQTARDDYARRIEEAEDALKADEIDRALLLVSRAEDGWRRAENFLPEDEYEKALQDAAKLRQRIKDRQAQLREEEAKMKAAEQAAGDVAAVSEAARKRREEINQALDRVLALEAEQKYEEAMQVLDQIRFLDPGNPTADLLYRTFSDIVMYRRWAEIQRKRPQSYAEEFLRIEGSLVAPQAILDYPDDWPELSKVRGVRAAYVEPEEDRKVAHTLDTQRLPFQFDDNMIESVFKYIEQLSPGININVDWAALQEAGIEKDTTVSLSLVNVPVRIGLERVLDQLNTGADEFNRIWYSIRDGIVNISLDSELRKFTVPVVYDIRDLLIDIPDHDDAPDLNLQTALQQGGGRGGGGGGANIFGGQGGDTVQTPTEQELTDQLVDLIQQTIDYDGWRDNGGDTGTIIPMRGNLIITQTPENHLKIEGLLSQLREIRSMQVNIEARFLSVAQDWFEQIGFDLDVVFNAQNNQFRSIATQNPGLVPTDLFAVDGRVLRNISGADTNLLVAQQGNNLGTPGTITLPDGREILTNIQAPQTVTIPGVLSQVPRPEEWSIGSGLQNSLGLAETLASRGFANTILSTSPALAMGATFLDDVQVDLLLKATQADRRTVTLTAPRLTVFNGQRSYIQVAVTQAFVSDLQPVTGDNAVGFDPTTSTVSSGVVLDVEATVSADRRYVTLHVDAQLAEVKDMRTVPVTATAGGGQVVSSNPNLGNTLSSPNQIASGFIELPEMQVSRVVTSVNVPDKGTVLLGGQRLVSDVEVETGVPILSKIPVINRFFTNRVNSKEESTLLILLRPQIIIQHEEEEKNFPGLLDTLRSSSANGNY